MSTEELKIEIANYIEKYSNDHVRKELRMPISLPTLNEDNFIIHHIYEVEIHEVSEFKEAENLWEFSGKATLRLSDKENTVTLIKENVEIIGSAYVRIIAKPKPNEQDFDVVKVVITKPTNIKFNYENA